MSVAGQPPGLPRPSDMISGGTFQSLGRGGRRTDPAVSPTPPR